MDRAKMPFWFVIGIVLSPWLGPIPQGRADARAREALPVVLDTDIGDDIDDAFALALVLSSPELDLRGVTTVSGDAYTRAVLTCRLLHLVGRGDIPVASGRPPRNPPDHRGQLQYGLRPAFGKRPERDLAVPFLYRKLKENPGGLTLLAIGPLTNLGELLNKHPDCKPWIRRIVLMGGSIKVGYNGKPPPEPEWNIKSDIVAAQTVFTSGVPLVVAPLDATTGLKLAEPVRQRIFHAGLLGRQLQALYQLWDQPTPTLYDPLAVTLSFDERFCTMEDLHLEVDGKGYTRVGKGKPNARVATSVRRDAFLRWFTNRLAPAAGRADSPALPLTNRSGVVPRGNLPPRVHVIEDYETDIERRWWLSGKLETTNVPPGSRRACRGVLTNDFDDRMGNPKGVYTAVIFNPVPGPPMGQNTRLAFRYWLKGTDQLRVQIYSLSNGYHRHLTLTGLPQESWQDAAVDLTAARRLDGSGGPLSADERIDDIQFYADADAELLIDDIVLYDAAPLEEKRPFPRRFVFTGWFDTGRQGGEWPGTFDIVPHKPPLTWKAARSVSNADTGTPWIRLSLRGERPLGADERLRFRYHLTGADTVQVALVNRGRGAAPAVAIKDLRAGAWDEATVGFERNPPRGGRVDEVRFLLPKGAELLVDDVLLYEPPDAKP